MKQDKLNEVELEKILSGFGHVLSTARANELDRLCYQKKDKRRRRHFTRKVCAAIITLCILAFGVTTVCSEALRTKIFGFFFSQDKGGYSDVVKNENNQSNNTEKILYPSYLPSGYKKVIDEDNALMHILQYVNSGGKEILIEQIKDKDLAYSIDTESSKKEEVVINSHAGFYVYGDENHILLWEENHIYMQITSSLQKEEMLKIARSLK